MLNGSRNFSVAELVKVSDGGRGVPAHLHSKANRAVALLQIIRDVIGVPFVLTSFYRSPERNEKIGGSDGSSHLDAEAFDFYPRGITLREFARRFEEGVKSGKIALYDQMIVYPNTTGHVHIGFGPRMRKQDLMKLDATRYASLNGYEQVPTRKNGAASVVVLVVLALMFVVPVVVRMLRQ